MRINYTTYDVRHAQDVINPNMDHRDIVLLSADYPGSLNHQYVYARVLGIYHINVIYAGPGMSDYHPKQMEFLWVRWFTNVNDDPVQRGWKKRQLDLLQLLPVNHEDSYRFVDPADVLRGSHLIPRFAKGMCYVDGKGHSKCARDSKDWHEYYVAR